ncbi:S8 family serine peptidase [Paraburkholderia sediminicola]|uniref:S8 family serine peptidase n=1 Tax=Paraburkholderia sediminicola TaxID=458836 RepID=UPI0038BD201A
MKNKRQYMQPQGGNAVDLGRVRRAFLSPRRLANVAYLSLLLSLVACGGSDEATPAVTSPVANTAAVPSLSDSHSTPPAQPPDPFNTNSLQVEALNERFIVKYKIGTGERRDVGSVRVRLKALARTLPVGATHVRRLATGADVVATDIRLDRAHAEAFMRKLAADPHVEYVEPDALVQAQLVPNDPEYFKQWAFNPSTNPTYWVGGIHAEPAWNISNGAGIVIAELDNGVTHHSDLDANLLPGIDILAGQVGGDGHNPGVTSENCTVTWHGTHVAGTLAAGANKGAGLVGTAWGSKIEPVRVLNPCGVGSISDVATGIFWASGATVPDAPANPHPAHVINMSLAGLGSCSRTVQEAIDDAFSRGVTIIVAAGNDGNDAAFHQPGNCSNVITVGAHNAHGSAAWFSNYGPRVDISAPGVNIWSTYNAGAAALGTQSYGYLDGTSMATPHVAGVVALMQSVAQEQLTPAQVKSLLTHNAQPFPTQQDKLWNSNAGMLNAAAVVTAAKLGQFPPTADFTFAFTADMQVTFSDKSVSSAGTLVARVWDFGDGNSHWTAPQGVTSPYVNYEYGGIYSVTLTVTNSSGVSDSVTKPVRVDPPEATALRRGEPVSGLAANSRATMYFKLDVPPGVTNMTISISGGTGDANLYVKRDSPTLLSPLCRPFLYGNDESCRFPTPEPGTYYVMLYGYSAFSGVTLIADYVP